MTIRWTGLIAPEEQATGDRRMFAAQALTYRDFPLPANFCRQNIGGHDGSVVVASWDRAYADEGGIWGTGTFLDPTVVPEVVEAIYLLDKKLIGPSVDLDSDLAYDVVTHPDREDDYAVRVTRATVHAVTFVMGPAFPQVHITVDNDEEYALLASAGISGAFKVNSSTWRKWPVAEREVAFDADDAIQRIAEWSGGDPAKFGSAFLYYDTRQPANNRESYRLPVADVRNGELTLIPRAVFSAATILSGAHGGLPSVSDEEKIKLQEVVTEMYDMLRDMYGDPRTIPPWQRGGREGATSSDSAPSTEASMQTITAAGVLAPDKSMFANPKLTKPTTLRVEGDRVYGHLAPWGLCHLGVGNRCVRAPRSATGYKLFKTGTVVCADGAVVQVGKITLDTGHADPTYGVIPAREHYDHTGTCVAVVNAGEDEFGIWVAGALVAGLTPERVAELRRSPLSGDWRRVDGNLELVAALAVNDPGFPIVNDDADGIYSLTAAGFVPDAVSDDVGVRVLDLSHVDDFLLAQDRADRRRIWESTALEDEGCGCNVRLPG